MEVQKILQQINNLDDVTLSDLTRWWKALNSDFILQAEQFGFNIDLSIIALMLKDVQSLSI